MGYDVLTAGDGPAALAVLRREAEIDILFSDIVMPRGMNGVELARTALRLRPQLRVLLASAIRCRPCRQHKESLRYRFRFSQQALSRQRTGRGTAYPASGLITPSPPAWLCLERGRPGRAAARRPRSTQHSRTLFRKSKR